jgi:hypothetical protein
MGKIQVNDLIQPRELTNGSSTGFPYPPSIPSLCGLRRVQPAFAIHPKMAR